MNGGADESQVDHRPAVPAGAEPVVIVRGLVKRYGRREAVRGIDLDVHRGEIFAFPGPNGAGKTTTVEILEGFRTRTAGELSVLGADPAEAGGAWRDRVGVVLQESEPEPGLSVRECVELYAGYYRARGRPTRRSPWSASPTRQARWRASCPEASGDASTWPWP